MLSSSQRKDLNYVAEYGALTADCAIALCRRFRARFSIAPAQANGRSTHLPYVSYIIGVRITQLGAPEAPRMAKERYSATKLRANLYRVSDQGNRTKFTCRAIT